MRPPPVSQRSVLTCVLFTLGLSAASADPIPRFPPDSVWNQDVSTAPLNTNSTNMISHTALDAWGQHFYIDFPFYVLHATAGTQTDPVVAKVSYPQPDCDAPGFAFPLPAGGGMSGTGPPFGGGTAPSYACSGDCYLLVVSGTTLYESFTSNVSAGTLQSGCALTWDLSKVYPHQGRGEQCVSTVQSGTPIAPLLFNADEMYAAAQITHGDLGHAIRFLLNNAKQGVYVHPGSDGYGSDSSVDAIPMGSRLRLRADFPVDTFIAGNLASSGPQASVSAQVLLRTLQKYGMILVDNGSVPLTAESDYYTTHKWAESGMDPVTQGGIALLETVQITDFEVVYTGEPITTTFNCARVADDFVFIDGYDY